MKSFAPICSGAKATPSIHTAWHEARSDKMASHLIGGHRAGLAHERRLIAMGGQGVDRSVPVSIWREL